MAEIAPSLEVALPTPRRARARLDQMYRAHHLLIWRTLRRLGHSEEAAADFTHGAFLIAAERLGDIREGAEKAYLFSTAIGLGRSSRRRERRMELPGELPESVVGEASSSPLDDQRAARDLLDRVLSTMDEDLVTVFVFHEIEGMTSPEIAEILNIPLGTVASRLRRAREAFRAEAARLERELAATSTPGSAS